MAAKKKQTNAQKTIKKVMRTYKKGTLKSGTSGKTVTSRDQAIAIGLSEARKKGEKVAPAPKAKKCTTATKKAMSPKKKTTATTKKATKPKTVKKTAPKTRTTKTK